MKRRPALVGGLPRLGPHELVLVLGCVHLLLDLVQVGVGDCLVAVEDLGDLLEGRAPGLDVEEPHKDELHRVPEGVEQHEVPVVGHVVPGELVGLAVVKKKKLVSTNLRNLSRLALKTSKRDKTYFPRARIACTVMFMIIIPLARRWKGRTSRA